MSPGDPKLTPVLAKEHRGMLAITRPMEHGLVTNWEDMEQIWSSVFTEHLKTTAEEVSF